MSISCSIFGGLTLFLCHQYSVELISLYNWTRDFFIAIIFFSDKLENNKIEVLFSLVKQGILRKLLFGRVRKENLQRQRVLKTLMSPTGTACSHV